MSRENLIPAGEILKVHGLEGGLVIRISELFYPFEKIPEFFFLLINGLPVPFFVNDAEAFGKGSYLVFFKEITTRDQALKYRDCEVLLEVKYVPREKKNAIPGDYAGYSFTDETSGKKGRVSGLVPVPENPFYEVNTGDNFFLIPAAKIFIVQVDSGTKQVIFRLPEGIFNPDNL